MTTEIPPCSTLVTTAEVLLSDGIRLTVGEDLSHVRGDLVVEADDGTRVVLGRTAEPVWADPDTLYLGLDVDAVMAADYDVLGRAVLDRAGDPDPALIASVFAPIAVAETFTFVGTPHCIDKVGTTSGGRTAMVDAAAYDPAVERSRAAGLVLDGLVGGWLPVVRFVHPDPDVPQAWTEVLLFAPWDSPSGNARVQAAWYRIARVESGRHAWVRYVDTFPAVSPRGADPDPGRFWADLLATRNAWEREAGPVLGLALPDPRLADQVRHSLARARMTRVDDWPKYGVLDRNYGGSEHDGFQDTFTVDVAAATDWGLHDAARRYIDNYLTHFVRDDGSIVYRGPGTGQYGRMLTVIARHTLASGDTATMLAHRRRIDAVADVLIDLRRRALNLPPDTPGHGLIHGWCEADSCLELHPERYDVPYLSNSAEAVRGWRELADAWDLVAAAHDSTDPALSTGLRKRATTLRREATALHARLIDVVDTSTDRTLDPPWLPVIAGETTPFHEAVALDDHHPQFRGYRANAELLHSGLLDRDQVRSVVDYREAHRDIVLGVPAAYGYTTDPGLIGNRELAGFLSYGHAYGLLHHDDVRAYLLELHALSAHQYTRGTWTAPETRRVRAGSRAAPYCSPAQLVVPLLVRWMLAFEEPDSEVLWLGKACPRAWFEHGAVIEAPLLPTRWGDAALRVESRLDNGEVIATVTLPPRARSTRLRLRLPEGVRVVGVTVGGSAWEHDPIAETVDLPPDTPRDPNGHVTVVARVEDHRQ